ncbi:ankyrin repeat domain-containing protein [Candidatus Babeliales bacterium]|nr:ankyrin repeat domain-containing protein [Candidatus Babeliales bacterium]
MKKRYYYGFVLCFLAINSLAYTSTKQPTSSVQEEEEEEEEEFVQTVSIIFKNMNSRFFIIICYLFEPNALINSAETELPESSIIEESEIETRGLGTTSTIPVNAKNEKGQTALHIACDQQNISWVNSLLGAGANPNIKCRQGCTPLHHAVERGDLTIIKVLLKHNANPNIQDNNGQTPLHWAYRYHFDTNTDVIDILEQNGAIKTIKDIDGTSAQDNFDLESCSCGDGFCVIL